jgi:hypothetical protein
MSRAEAMREARKLARQFQADPDATPQTRAIARLVDKLKRNRGKFERFRGNNTASGLTVDKIARAKELAAELHTRRER